MTEDFLALLQSWKGSEVTVINPESYTSTALREGLGFESYSATLAEITPGHIMLSYTAQRKGKSSEVQQWIPFLMVKRITLMGDEKFLHL